MQTAYTTPTLPAIKDAQIGILISKWYREYTERMNTKCIELLLAAGAKQPQVHILPGSLELPLAAQTLIKRVPQIEALICFGAVVKGDTYHFDLVVQGCSTGLNRVSLDQDIPIIVEVLPVNDIEQLKKRSSDDTFNKGIEAALAAAEIIAWRRSIGHTRAGK